jgi:hypothetical protein
MNKKPPGNGPPAKTSESSKPKPLVWAIELRWIGYLMLFEFFLAANMSSTVLTNHPYLVPLVDLAQTFAPVIGKIDASIVKHPERVRLFIALTVFILPVKMLIVYRWLRRKPAGVYSAVVISPLTDTQVAKGIEWMEIEEDSDTSNLPRKPRSMRSRVIWSLLILAMAAGSPYVLFDGLVGFGATKIGGGLPLLDKGVVSMWFHWVVRGLVFSMVMVPVGVCIIQDYVTYFKQRIASQREASHQ